MAVLSSALRRTPAAPAAAQRTRDLAAARRQALVAAASGIPLDGTGWKSFKLGDTAWQGEAWSHYDICGELRFVANWIGSSVSRCRLYVAELDELGRPGKEVEEPDVAVLAETVFGSPAKRAEAQRLLGQHLYVPGESYIVAEGVENANEDRWYVVSTSGVKRQGDREIMVERPQEYGGGWYTLKPGTDLLIRVWTPHPRKPDLADSSVRPALPILREIEQLTKHVFAQIDSRLAGAGLLLLPDQLDFPRGEDDPDGAAGLMKVLQRAMAAALQDRADPSSLVPIMAQVPGEFIDKVRHLTFETPLAAAGMEIRDRAIRRLGLSLDVDPEILLGKGDTNHWTAWQLEESTIKVHIEPLLARICDALTAGYLRAALTVLGKDPDAYTFWYDVSPLTVRPNRQEDALSLFEQDAISEEALRTAGAWSEDDAPDDDERLRRLVTKLVLSQPDLIREKAIQQALGIELDLEPKQAAPAAPGAPQGELPPADDSQQDGPRDRALPAAPRGTQDAAQAALLMGAHMVVQRSLELAGKRLLTRTNRDKYRDVPPWELHTVIHVLEGDHAERLLSDTFATVPMLAERTGVPAAELSRALAGYCRELLVRAVPHDIDTLEQFLGWCLDASSDERDAWFDHADGEQFHLPGLHDQRNHGRKRGRPGFEPFTPAQKRERAAERARNVDPDRDASAPDRQGRRAFAAWEQEASVLAGRFERERRDEIVKVVDEKPPGMTDRERLDAEWAQRERELRDQQAVQAARFYLMLEGDPARDQRMRDLNDAFERQLAEAREGFFDVNPDELTDGGLPWHYRLQKDTEWDAPVPVFNLTVQQHKVKHGYAWRRDGVTYVVETPAGTEPADASRPAQELARMHAERLPENATEFQKGYLWTSAASPSDAYWQQRFNNPNHQAAASAGDGSVVFWQKRHDTLPGDVEANHIVHEFGHNFDKTSTTGGRISRSPEWGAAMVSDHKGNGATGPSRRRVVDFVQRRHPGQFPISLHEGHGKEAPYGVTTYGKSSLAEDLAESLELYRQGPVGEGRVGGPNSPLVTVYFRDIFPGRAKILDAEFPEFARQQKAEIRRARRARP